MQATAHPSESTISVPMRFFIGLHAGFTAAVIAAWLALDVAGGAPWAVTAATVYAVAAPVLGVVLALRMKWGAR